MTGFLVFSKYCVDITNYHSKKLLITPKQDRLS